jgi:hypothetical protein
MARKPLTRKLDVFYPQKVFFPEDKLEVDEEEYLDALVERVDLLARQALDLKPEEKPTVDDALDLADLLEEALERRVAAFPTKKEQLHPWELEPGEAWESILRTLREDLSEDLIYNIHYQSNLMWAGGWPMKTKKADPEELEWAMNGQGYDEPNPLIAFLAGLELTANEKAHPGPLFDPPKSSRDRTKSDTDQKAPANR